MELVLKQQTVLTAAECDMMGAWRPDAILTCMQETAGAHSASFGLARAYMDGLGICWVLSRQKVVLLRTPRVYEEITVETYPLPQRLLFFPRVHVFKDKDGEEIGYACALWALMDMKERKLTASEEVSSRLPRVAGLKNPAGLPGTVRMPEGAQIEESLITPRFTELDLNRHVNNTKYLSWCQDALGIDCMKEKEIASFQINYDAEVLPGVKVTARLLRDGEAFVFCGSDGDKALFSVDGVLRERK